MSVPARLHLRPTWFVDTPVGRPDGSVARLAGGMRWFAGYDVLRDGAYAQTVPVGEVATLAA